MRLISANAEECLHAVRALSERAVNAPLRRPLSSRASKFLPWPVPERKPLEFAVYRPWRRLSVW